MQSLSTSPRQLPKKKSDPREIYENSKYIKGFTVSQYTPEMLQICDKLANAKAAAEISAHILYGSSTIPILFSSVEFKRKSFVKVQ